MSLRVNLSREAEARISEQAAALGMKVEDYAAKLLEGSASPSPLKMTGAQAIEYWKNEGVLGSRKDIRNSVVHAQRLRQRSEHRER